MPRKAGSKHWTQKVQYKRGDKYAIREEYKPRGGLTVTWDRGYEEGSKGYLGPVFLGWTTQTGIRKGVFIPKERLLEYETHLIEQGYERVSANHSIRRSATKRDYKAKKVFNRPVFRVK